MRHRRSFEYAVFLPGSADISDSNVQTSYLYALYANLRKTRVTGFSNGTAIDCTLRSAVICVLDRKQSELSAGWGSYAVILLVSSLGPLSIAKFNGLNVHCFVVAHFSALYVYYFRISCPYIIARGQST